MKNFKQLVISCFQQTESYYRFRVTTMLVLHSTENCTNKSHVFLEALLPHGSGRSQWPCGLRHELPSLARTLGLLVRIPLKAWISVGIFSAFVLFSV
jgi:hypothetical protein